MFGKKQKGFTIVELVTTIIGLGVAAAILICVVGVLAALINLIYKGFFGG